MARVSRPSVIRLLSGFAVAAVLFLRAAPSFGFLLSTSATSQRLSRSLRRASQDTSLVKTTFADTGAKEAVDVQPEPEETPDDGKILDTSSPTGFVGSIVVTIALLPYIAIILYSAWTLTTTGSSIETILVASKGGGSALAPNGWLGIAEVLSYVTIGGVVLWSLVSFIFRFRGLPEGGLSTVQNLAYLTGVVVLGATALDGQGEDNPFRGISVNSSPTELQSAATKAKTLAEKTGNKAADETKKFVDKETTEILTVTAGPRSQIDSTLKEVGDKISSKINIKVPDVRVPDVKLPDIKLPDMKLPDVKLPDAIKPESKAPEVKPPGAKPETKAPEAKPTEKAPETKAKAPEVKPAEVKAPELKPADTKAPEVKPAEAKAPEVKPAEAKAEKPAEPAPKKVVDINDLFD
mmetsp:Transcript_75725/g.133746  ORF Transcript_75725/g.133746 Transcript_75725/m.133746 type:complete len:408 (-) Transcript_75725:139-1362(-)|eukprot:CAMPEP_0197626514 /NCGR_PEP_ID=MMETSP1338-20131121/5445_1 /TAXON_ID=43686 ORGANISM="Pelagodinium beii, Strain RCC1491" /NCGR_SAMPLE_ID=MMETSP1338 /ASSEMBLY_ACC=CAM_ASM_000754 /LENGTH=407 /DNA_ID=CAMNT_0043197055 /DNA_START=72 /DNA_END=1295 /DNA_ORIENTATION=+